MIEIRIIGSVFFCESNGRRRMQIHFTCQEILNIIAPFQAFFTYDEYRSCLNMAELPYSVRCCVK